MRFRHLKCRWRQPFLMISFCCIVATLYCSNDISGKLCRSNKAICVWILEAQPRTGLVLEWTKIHAKLTVPVYCIGSQRQQSQAQYANNWVLCKTFQYSQPPASTLAPKCSGMTKRKSIGLWLVSDRKYTINLLQLRPVKIQKKCNT